MPPPLLGRTSLCAAKVGFFCCRRFAGRKSRPFSPHRIVLSRHNRYQKTQQRLHTGNLGGPQCSARPVTSLMSIERF